MRIVNAAVYGDSEPLVDITLADGLIAQIEPASGKAGDLDAQQGLVLPPFVEPHVHLDTALTAGEPNWNRSGTLFEGIERWAERKATLSHADVKRRAHQVLRWQLANGIQFVRSHVDISDPKLVALKALLEVKQEISPWLELQLVAFPQEGLLSYPGGLELLQQALELGADVVGAIPHFEYSREYGIESLQQAFKLAHQYDRMLDIHCDEIDDEQSRFIETVATLAYEYGNGARVTASHTTAMHSYNDAYASKLFRLLTRTGVHFVANPLVNVHLQGRFDSYPKRRGITRVKEMLAAGINVCFGHDDLFDPWYPLGTANMLQVVHMGLHLCQMMGIDEIEQSLALITANSAAALGLQERYGIAVGKPANLLILPARNGYDAVRRQTLPQYVFRHGQLLAARQPERTRLHLERDEWVDFCR